MCYHRHCYICCHFTASTSNCNSPYNLAISILSSAYQVVEILSTNSNSWLVLYITHDDFTVRENKAGHSAQPWPMPLFIFWYIAINLI